MFVWIATQQPGGPPLVGSDWLDSTSGDSDWSNEEAPKVGCLVILRKLMCYFLSAQKDQEVCALCVAEKFFTLLVPDWGKEGNRCPPKIECELQPTSHCSPGATSGKEQKITLLNVQQAVQYFTLERKGGFQLCIVGRHVFKQVNFN